MLQAWSRGTLQKSLVFADYLKLITHFSYKSKETKVLAIPLHFHPLRWNLLRNVLRSSIETQRVHLTPLSTLTGRWRDDVELVLGEFKRCSVVRGGEGILWTVKWPAILPLHYPGTPNNYDSKREGRWSSGQHQTNCKKGMMEGSLLHYLLWEG